MLLVTVIATEAHWQQLLERHQDVIGDIIAAMVEETRATGPEEMEQVFDYASQAKNRRPGRSRP